MNKPIVLYDQNHERVGETYHRRAKQLIRSGRAAWLEEGQSMQISNYISYPPKKEDTITMSDHMYNNNGTPVEEPKATPTSEPSSLLLYIANKNVTERRNLIRHIIAYVLVWAIVLPLSSFNYVPFRQDTRNRHARNEIAVAQSHILIPDIVEHWDIPLIHWSRNGYGIFNAHDTEIFRRNIDEVVHALSAFYSPNVAVTTNTRSGLSQSWHFIMGALAAWGVWILVRSIKIFRQNARTRAPKAPRPDPVALEYQRLMSTQ